MRSTREAVADEHDDWEDIPTEPGVRPLSNEQISGLGTQYHLSRSVPRNLTREQLTELLDEERAKVAQAVRALTMVRSYPEQADGIAAVALRLLLGTNSG